VRVSSSLLEFGGTGSEVEGSSVLMVGYLRALSSSGEVVGYWARAVVAARMGRRKKKREGTCMVVVVVCGWG